MNSVFLKQKMFSKGLDTATLAERCLVAPRYMEQVLKGLTPSKRLVASIAKELGCRPLDLAPEIYLSTEKTIVTGGKKIATGN